MYATVCFNSLNTHNVLYYNNVNFHYKVIAGEIPLKLHHDEPNTPLCFVIRL